jgi:hypothetical protein
MLAMAGRNLKIWGHCWARLFYSTLTIFTRRPAFSFGFSGKAVFLRGVFFSIKRASLSGEIEVKDFVSTRSFFLKQYWVNKDWTPTWLGTGMQAKPALEHQRRTGSSC